MQLAELKKNPLAPRAAERPGVYGADELPPGTGLNYLVLSAHDYRSPRKANIHFISRELAQRGQVRFFSLRYSWLSKRTGDPRLSLDSRANRIEHYEGVECFLWKTPVHPFNTRRSSFRVLESLMYRCYRAAASPVLRDWLAQADVILFESGIAPVFFSLAKRLNPTARTIYIASDGLETIGVAAYVRRCFEEAAPCFSQIRLPSERLARKMPPGAKLCLIPQGIDHDLAEEAGESPFGPGIHCVSVGSMLFDPEFFVEASRRLPDIRFHIIGSGLDTHPGYGPNVRVYGEMPHRETVRWIRHASVGIAPYRAEGLPDYLADTSMKLIQYDFLGVPAVCPAQVVGDYASRYGYIPGDGQSIVDALQAALEAPRRASRRHLSWAEVTDRLMAPARFPGTELST